MMQDPDVVFVRRRPKPPVERLMIAAGMPVEGGGIPIPDLVLAVLGDRAGRFATVLKVVEDLLGEDRDTRRVAEELIAGLRDATSPGAEGPVTGEDLLPWRGPRTVRAWERG